MLGMLRISDIPPGQLADLRELYLSHLNLVSSVRALELAWRWVKDDTLILALPLFHMHGLGGRSPRGFDRGLQNYSSKRFRSR